jgi:hypothetical protein
VLLAVEGNLLLPALVVLNIMRPLVRPVDVQLLYHLFLVKTVLSIVVTASRPNERHAVLAAMISVVITVVAIVTIVVMAVGAVVVTAAIDAITVILAGN